MNLKQNALVMGAVKSAISAGSGVILANMVDVPQALFSWPWFRHVLVATGMVVLISEARFWKQWADSATVIPVDDSLQAAGVASAKAGAAIAEAQKVVSIETDAAKKP